MPMPPCFANYHERCEKRKVVVPPSFVSGSPPAAIRKCLATLQYVSNFAAWQAHAVHALLFSHLVTTPPPPAQTAPLIETEVVGSGLANATARGFEPLRAEPNGFRVHLLSHSDTLSCTCGCPAANLSVRSAPTTALTFQRHVLSRGLGNKPPVGFEPTTSRLLSGCSTN